MAEQYQSTESSIRQIIDYALDNANTAIPAYVTKYNSATQTVDVQVPFLDIYEIDGQSTQQEHPWPELPDVPIVFPRGGGWSITWPLSKGDNVLLVFAQRSIDDWWATNGQSKISPVDLRRQDISDAFAIPGPPTDKTKLKADHVSATDLIIRHSDGTELQIGKAGTVSITGSRLNIGSESASVALAKGQVTTDQINTLTTRVNTISAILSLPPIVHVGTINSSKAFTND